MKNFTNTETRAILNKMETLKTEIDAAYTENNLDKCDELQQEFNELKRQYVTLKNNTNNIDFMDEIGTPIADDDKTTPIQAFAQAARTGFRVNNAMTETTLTSGGYTVPEDIQTAINKYRDAEFSLRELVSVVPVKTLSGSRVFQKRSTQTGFKKNAEGGKTTEGNTPEFVKLDYTVEKYDGYYPVTQELLDDSDANITNVLTEWIGDEARVTDNNIIIEAINTKTAEDITVTDDDLIIDDIKKVLNIDLGAAFKTTSAIITNDDGINYIDTLKDMNGRYLLGADPTEPGKMLLRCGATQVPIVTVPNSTLPSDVTTTGKRGVPFIIGDLKEGIVIFDRENVTIRTSDVATVGTINSFESDQIIFKGTLRECAKVRDDAAFVNLNVIIDDVTTA